MYQKEIVDQIEAARKAHSSIRKYQQGLGFDLNSSPIILNKPNRDSIVIAHESCAEEYWARNYYD